MLGLPVMGLQQAGRSSVKTDSCGKSTQEQIQLIQGNKSGGRKQQYNVSWFSGALKTIKSWMVTKLFPLLPS